MLFQTWAFLIFISVVLASMILVRRSRNQQFFLLAASYLFYGWWDVRFLIPLCLSSMLNYAAALGIRGVRLSWKQRGAMSALTIAATALFLGVNWTALQSDMTTAASIFPPTWPGHRAAIGATLAFALLGPLLYEIYFKLNCEARRRAFLWTSVVVNLGILSFFKYFNFFRDNLIGLGGMVGFDSAIPAIHVALPIGISFYTFQTMSYTIDVYRGRIEPERSLRRVALYVAYFPQLVAGPILRPKQFLPALQNAWVLREPAMRAGFHLILVGMFKKVLIADHVAPLADFILGDPGGKPSILIMFGAALFAVQIYCDFSGYTDIARGISRMMGVEIPLNFDFPYFSKSITEFWRRWHISLSSWLRDYLYIPLGGNRKGVYLTYFNLMATMVLGGLWHGAAWNFAAWGAYHGCLLGVNRFMANWASRHPSVSAWIEKPVVRFLRWGITLYLTLLGWIIFRCTDPDQMLLAAHSYLIFDGRWGVTSMGIGAASPFTATLAFLGFIAIHSVGRFWRRWPDTLDRASRAVQFGIYVLLGLVFFFLWPSSTAPFIYFQF